MTKSGKSLKTAAAKAPLRERILVVEDEEDILELLRYNLTREGYRVRTAATDEG